MKYSLIISVFFAFVAGWFISCSLYYRKKWRDLRTKYDNCCTELTKALEEVKRMRLLNGDIIKENMALNDTIEDYKHLANLGCRNLKMLERTKPISANIPQGIILVVCADTRRSDLYFPIKTFLYHPEDPEDREFAIRQAEELIETINNF